MKTIHFICRRKRDGQGGLEGVSRVSGEQDTYTSEAWKVNLSDMQELVDGQIYLHQARAEASHFGGKVLEVYQINSEDNAQASRVGFKFKAEREARGVAWQGRQDPQAWTSGVVSLKDEGE
jgi:hypothetical protein